MSEGSPEWAARTRDGPSLMRYSERVSRYSGAKTARTTAAYDHDHRLRAAVAVPSGTGEPLVGLRETTRENAECIGSSPVGLCHLTFTPRFQQPGRAYFLAGVALMTSVASHWSPVFVHTVETETGDGNFWPWNVPVPVHL